MTPDEYCQQKAAASGSSFYYAFLFLPAERRRAITAIYAYCREVDDAVDEVSEPSVAAARLQWWRGEIAALFGGQPTPMRAARYHSLAVEESSLPADLEVSARSDDGVVMGIRHRSLPVEGVQFHPESFLSPEGPALLRNFLEAPR